MSKSYKPIYQWPNPNYKAFEGEEHHGRITKDLKNLKQSDFGGWWPCFFPTAIGFLVTAGSNRINVMTSSCLVVMCAYPFTIGLPIFTGTHSPRGDGPRFSYELLQETKQFTINLGYISEEMTKKAIICGTLSGRDYPDKITKAAFTTLPSKHIIPPLLKECPLNLECSVLSMTPIGTHTWVAGSVLAVHSDPSLASGNHKYEWRSMPDLIPSS